MRKKEAYTIIEVIIALAIGVMSLYLASRIQISSLNRVARAYDSFVTLFLLKRQHTSFLLNPPVNVLSPKKEKYEKEGVTITSSYEEIPKKSPCYFLHDKIKKVVSNTVPLAQKRAKNPDPISLVSFTLNQIKEPHEE